MKTKLWKYEPTIKTTDQLWDNFKVILEQHNQNTLDHPLSTVELNQVKKLISDIQTPYEDGKIVFLPTVEELDKVGKLKEIEKNRVDMEIEVFQDDLESLYPFAEIYMGPKSKT